jgi:hypothetical protein
MATHAHSTTAPAAQPRRLNAPKPTARRKLPRRARRPSRWSRAQRLRRELEAAVERALALLDAIDGDPDLEHQCEDEGAQCDDEGVVELSVVAAPAYYIVGRAH